MALHDLKYTLDDEGIELMAGCATQHIIEEIKAAVSVAFRQIIVTIDHDEDFGICRLVAVNGKSLCRCD